MSHPAWDPDLAVHYLEGDWDVTDLLSEASRLRDEGHGRTVTYSRKVFVPLTNLCRDRCTYCTFVQPPGNGGGYLEPQDVLAITQTGQRHGCTEALFTLGDSPESKWPAARKFLDEQGVATTLEYVALMTELVVSETGLLPHANPGVMSRHDIDRLRPSNPSMGLMLENVSPRLMEPGMPHDGCPDKDPAVRLASIQAAGEAMVPFTSGVLVGIGETNAEIVASLVALRDVHARYGHIQEVIVQNFRAKAGTRMRGYREPDTGFMVRLLAVARWLFGPEMTIQVPPNLTDGFETYLEAGVNDWGGVSPVTIDFVNPERPWPHLDELAFRTQKAGFELRPRLPVHPKYISSDWIDPRLESRVRSAADDEGFARIHERIA